MKRAIFGQETPAGAPHGERADGDRRIVCLQWLSLWQPLYEKASKDYLRARGIFEEVAPYADATVAKYLLPKIPLSHYFEGAEHEMQQEYGEAMVCYRKAFEGFQKTARRATSFPP